MNLCSWNACAGVGLGLGNNTLAGVNHFAGGLVSLLMLLACWPCLHHKLLQKSNTTMKGFSSGMRQEGKLCMPDPAQHLGSPSRWGGARESGW